VREISPHTKDASYIHRQGKRVVRVTSPLWVGFKSPPVYYNINYTDSHYFRRKLNPNTAYLQKANLCMTSVGSKMIEGWDIGNFERSEKNEIQSSLSWQQNIPKLFQKAKGKKIFIDSLATTLKLPWKFLMVAQNLWISLASFLCELSL
jgi:hypothetical protein